jgi:hypothetical protein
MLTPERHRKGSSVVEEAQQGRGREKGEERREKKETKSQPNHIF